jgi:hypothetical protein
MFDKEKAYREEARKPQQKRRKKRNFNAISIL